MKNFKNIALISIFAMITIPQNMLCLMDFEENENSSYTQPEKSRLQKIKDWTYEKITQARNYFNKKSEPIIPPSQPDRVSENFGVNPASIHVFAGDPETQGFHTNDNPNNIDLSKRFVKQLPNDNALARFEGKGIKKDYDLLKEYLSNADEYNNQLNANEIILKEKMTKLTATQRANLLTEITRNEIKQKNYNSDDAAMIFEKNITKFNTILPETDLVVLLHDNKSFNNTNRKSSIQSYHFTIIDMDKYNPKLSPKQNYDRMNQDHNLDMSLNKFIRNIRDYYQKNNPAALRSVDQIMHDANIKYLKAHPAKLQEMTYQFFHSEPTPLSPQETAELEATMKVISASQKAEIFTNVMRQKIKEIESKRGHPLTKKEISDLFKETLVDDRYQKDLWPKITSPNDLIMITHDKAKSPSSYRFQIANMKDFNYNTSQTADQNAERLAKTQNLQIQPSNLVDSVMDFYFKNDPDLYKTIFDSQITNILDYSKNPKTALTNFLTKALNRQLSKSTLVLTTSIENAITDALAAKPQGDQALKNAIENLKYTFNHNILVYKSMQPSTI